ncbi:hypothetical protein AB205_0194400 [Aquarana catesbeiana]|uniref:Uncharacterized protein n=1 Tax=Aquarana catesbeiana TaxID=8400 RepID=A0A2G9S2D1_AQUCT|nr:hypothetical protein AB205_0194400 [Aquarana catesbeiana]
MQSTIQKLFNKQNHGKVTQMDSASQQEENSSGFKFECQKTLVNTAHTDSFSPFAFDFSTATLHIASIRRTSP